MKKQFVLRPDDCKRIEQAMNRDRHDHRMEMESARHYPSHILPTTQNIDILKITLWLEYAGERAPVSELQLVLDCPTKTTYIVRGYAEDTGVQAARCSYCDGTGDVHGLDGEWRGVCTECEAGTSPHMQAAPKTAPVDALDEVMRERDEAEDFINELLDEVLGADRPEWSSAYNRYDAMSDVRERITALHKPAVDKAFGQFQSAMAAPHQALPPPGAGQYEMRHKGSAGIWSAWVSLGGGLVHTDIEIRKVEVTQATK